jgi:tetratricopeptide (TPR) repeat protein
LFFGYERIEKFFFGEPHNIIVSIFKDHIHINQATDPESFYYFKHGRKYTQICDVFIPAEFLEYCLQMYKNQIENEKLKKYIKSYEIIADCDLYYQELELGNDAFNKNKKVAIEHYIKALEYKKNDAYVLYNLACCYADDDIHKSLYYIKEAINQGFINVTHFKSDPDLKSLKENLEFKKIINDLDAFDSARSVITFSPPYTDNDISEFFEYFEKAIKNSLFKASFLKSFHGLHHIQDNPKFIEIVNQLKS